MKSRKIICIIVSLILIATSVLIPDAIFASAAADTTAPVIDISTLKVSKKDVKPGDTVRISLKVTDNVKVDHVLLTYSSPQTEKDTFCNMKYDISTDEYIHDFNITNNTESGLWRIRYISCSDSSSNNSKYFNSKMTTVLTPNADLSAADFKVSTAENPTEERYDFEVALGSTLSLSYEANCDIKWISSDPSIAKVTDVVQSSITMGSYKRIMSSCTIVPVKEGIVTIYAADENGLMLNSAKVKVTKANYVLGDVDQDGKINASDALYVLQHSVDKITLTGDQFSAGDVVKDGKLNSSDALKILQYSVGSISKF